LNELIFVKAVVFVVRCLFLLLTLKVCSLSGQGACANRLGLVNNVGRRGLNTSVHGAAQRPSSDTRPELGYTMTWCLPLLAKRGRSRWWRGFRPWRC
jgi:hypothetical protein